MKTAGPHGRRTQRLGQAALWIMVLLGAVVGLGTGVGTYTFVYAKGASYLTNDPRACANCHIMQEHYDAWLKSSHHNVATCNDCHTPHNLVGKYATKASNGYHHSMAFTTGRFREPIQIKPGNRRITEQACRHCHQDVVEAIEFGTHYSGDMSCIRCHATVGHMD